MKNHNRSWIRSRARIDKRKKIEEKKFTKKGDQGRIVEEFSVMDYIKQRKPVRYEPLEFMYWRAIQHELIEEIAFQAYRRMVTILNALLQHLPD